MGFRPLRAKIKILGNFRASNFRLSQFSRACFGLLAWSISYVFVFVVLVVVAFGDPLVLDGVSVFHCNVYDLCRSLSCALTLGKIK